MKKDPLNSSSLRMSSWTAVLLFNMFCFSSTLFNCIPPPPELQQARERKAMQQQQRTEMVPARREAPPVKNLLVPVGPGEIDQLEPDLELPADTKFPMKILPFEKDAVYTQRLVRTFLESNDISAGHIFTRHAEKKVASAVKEFNLTAMFRQIEDYQYTFFAVSGLTLEDMLQLAKHNVPFFASLSRYVRTGSLGEMGTFILVYGYKGYAPGNPGKGKITYQGFQEYHLSIPDFISRVQTVFIPVKDQDLFVKVQKLWQVYRTKTGGGGMPMVQMASVVLQGR